MSDDWEGIAKTYWDDKPHPRDPTGKLRIGEFATAVKLATMAKFGGHASPHEATLFWPEFKASGLSPEEFEQTLDRIAPLSFTFHGRPPTMQEIAQFKDKQPHEARKYFADLPDKHYPNVSAGDMVKVLAAAKPHAEEHLDRAPNKYEAQYLHHSGESPSEYYRRIAPPKDTPSDTLTGNGVPPENRGDPGGRGVADSRRPAPDQRTPNRE